MTKKIFSLLLTLVISIGAWASDIEIDGIWYNFNSTDLTATVTYKGASYTQYKDEYTGDITIPSTVIYEKKEYSVTHIGSFAFSGCQNLVSVTIGDNVFVGAGTIVLPGVSIGSNVVIGAGSVVSRDIPDKCVAVGNPARVVKSLDEYLNKEKERMKGDNVFGEEYTLRNPNFGEVERSQMLKAVKEEGCLFVK